MELCQSPYYGAILFLRFGFADPTFTKNPAISAFQVFCFTNWEAVVHFGRGSRHFISLCSVKCNGQRMALNISKLNTDQHIKIHDC